jgi:VWFA-related protein
MRPDLSLILAGTVILASVVGAQRDMPASVDLVELDVAVVDGGNQPVTGLTRADFTVKEDGAVVELKTFEEVKADASPDPEDVRSVVILMDDAAVPAAGNRAMQTIARAFVQSAAPSDEISIVRLHSRSDEPFGDRHVAEFRIAGFQANSVPFTDWVTPEETLKRVATLSRQLEADDHRRKLIVCVGAPAVCNIEEPAESEVRRSFWSAWVDALSASARASVAVYAVVPGQAILRGGGLVDLTGGEVFATMYDVGPAIDRILRDAGNYYMLGYWPAAGKTRQLHSIDVKVARRGVKAHARRKRGV